MPFQRLIALKENFGWHDQTQFTGYWKSADWVNLAADVSPVVVSLYRRPGKVMFVVMNNSDKSAEATLTPDWGKLGVTEPKELIDGYTATGLPEAPLDLQELGNTGAVKFKGTGKLVETVKVPVAAGQVKVAVAPRNFRALVAQ